MSTALHGIKGQMDEFRGQINTITEDLVKTSDFNTNEIKHLEAKQQVQPSLITELRQELSEAVTTIKTQATPIEDLVLDKNALETYMRRSNLIFEGCTESQNENTTDTVEHIINNVLNLNVGLHTVSEIDKAHRYGRSVAGRPRPIIVRFVRHSVRDYVPRSANKLQDYHGEMFINEDLPAFTKSRRALRLIMQNAKAEGVAAKQTGGGGTRSRWPGKRMTTKILSVYQQSTGTP